MAGLLSTTANPNISNKEITDFIAGANGDNNAIYQAALANGISADQIATAMGGTKGFTVPAINQYVAQQNSTPSPSPTPTPTPTPVPDYSNLYGTGNPDITAADIQQFINTPGRTDQQVLDEAARLGVSQKQITDAMAGNPAYTPSNVQQYLESRNIFNPNQAAIDEEQKANDYQGLLSQQQDFRSIYNVPTPRQPDLGAYQPNYATAAIATQDPTLGTVAGQLDRVLNKNSPVMQQAKTFGAQQANRRGLLNSSMGISAAENEMIRVGLPIASADAQSNNQFALANQQASQQTNMFNADIERQYDLTKLGITKEMAINAENIARDYGLAQIDTESKIKIANINAASKSSSDAAGLNDRLLAGINEINGRNVSQQAKDAQIRTLVSATDGAIAMLGAFDSIGSSLNFNASTSGQNRADNLAVGNSGGDSGAGEIDQTTGRLNPITTSSGYQLSGQELTYAKKLVDATPGADLNRIVTKQEQEDIRNSGPQGGLQAERILSSFEKLYDPGTSKGNTFLLMRPA